MVKKRVFGGAMPTPILAEERAIMDSMGSIMDVDGGLSKTLGPNFRSARKKKSLINCRDDQSTVFVEDQVHVGDSTTKVRRVKKMETQIMLINNSSQASINTKAQTRTVTGANPSMAQLLRNDSSSVVMLDETMLDPVAGSTIMHQLK